MMAGKKLTHRHFSDDEWVSMLDEETIILEDGVQCSPEEFWRFRQDESWKHDWEFFSA